MRTDDTRRPGLDALQPPRRRAREAGSVPPHAALYMRERKELHVAEPACAGTRARRGDSPGHDELTAGSGPRA